MTKKLSRRYFKKSTTIKLFELLEFYQLRACANDESMGSLIRRVLTEWRDAKITEEEKMTLINLDALIEKSKMALLSLEHLVLQPYTIGKEDYRFEILFWKGIGEQKEVDFTIDFIALPDCKIRVTLNRFNCSANELVIFRSSKTITQSVLIDLFKLALKGQQ